jgi:acyl carrier protein
MDAALSSWIEERENVIVGVKAILIESLHVGREAQAIDLDAPLFGTGLALDSVDALELVVATETRFAITFPQSALRGALRTVNTWVDLILVLKRGEVVT